MLPERIIAAAILANIDDERMNAPLLELRKCRFGDTRQCVTLSPVESIHAQIPDIARQDAPVEEILSRRIRLQCLRQRHRALKSHLKVAFGLYGFDGEIVLACVAI